MENETNHNTTPLAPPIRDAIYYLNKHPLLEVEEMSGVAKGIGRIVLATEEVAALKEASRQIFGNLPFSQGRTGNKVLRKALIGEKVATYYPVGMYRVAKTDWYGYKTDLEIWRENRLSRAYLRGNPPTKKGQGKRAQGKKKK